MAWQRPYTFQWRHNERDGVSSHQRLDCLPNRLSRRRSTKTWKLHVTGFCEGKINPGCSSDDTHPPLQRHVDVMISTFHVTGTLWRKFLRGRWIPLSKGQWCENWMLCLLLFPITVEKTSSCWWFKPTWCSCDVTVIDNGCLYKLFLVTWC